MANSNSSPAIRNTVFWTNTAAISGTAIYNEISSPVLTNTLIQDGCPPEVGTCYGAELTSDPLFVRDPDSGDGYWTTPDDNDYGDLRLSVGSPAINQGDNSFVSGIDTDLAGNDRIQNGTVDLGAYETGYIRLYVDDTAPGANNGATWEHAFLDLQSALAMAGSGDEIWVATGVYTPGTTVSDTFGLVDGVEIYGGFAATETLKIERDWDTNLTILSGDIDGNDGKDTNGVVTATVHITGTNSFHVVTSTNVLSSTVLDGFIITAGDADGSNPNNRGGGMYNNSSSPTLTNLSFSGNSAADGGGMNNSNHSNPILTNVTFSGNSANKGGGMYNSDGSNPTLTNVAFVGNSAKNGGGIYDMHNSFILTNVIFVGNSADQKGGGMYNFANNPTLTNATFVGNSADHGGGMFNTNGNNPAIRNTIFWTNTAAISGTAIYNTNGGSPVLTNALVQGGCGSISGATCAGIQLSTDPLFVRNPDSGDGSWTTLADNDYGDLRLTLGSFAINLGDNSFVSVGTDLDGNPRIFDAFVDLGAYEFQQVVSRLFLPLIVR